MTKIQKRALFILTGATFMSAVTFIMMNTIGFNIDHTGFFILHCFNVVPTKQLILDYWLLAPCVSLACEALRWATTTTLDKSLVKNHWVHSDITPRLGGVCIFVALLSTGISFWDDINARNLALTFFAATATIFMIGLIEDIFSRGSAVTRLLLSSLVVISSCSAGFYYYHIAGINDVSIYSAVLLFIFLCVSGVTLIHGANLIDGSNGLCVFWGLGAISALWICLPQPSLLNSTDINIMENFIVVFCLCLIGFLFVNFPFGRMFLGDSGAYLIGCFVFSLGAILLISSPDLHTIMRVGAAFSYPIMEVGCSVLRRVLITKSPILSPDQWHLHSLLQKSMRAKFANISKKSANNHASAVILFFVITVTSSVSIFLPSDPLISVIVWMLCPASYCLIYGLAFLCVANAGAKRLAQPTKNQH